MSRPEAAFAAALSALPGMGPTRLAGLLDRLAPSEAWAAVLDRRITRQPADDAPRLPLAATLGAVGPRGGGGVGGRGRGGGGVGGRGRGGGDWADSALPAAVERMAEQLQQTGVQVTWRGCPDYPSRLVEDPQPPGVLFWRGDLRWLSGPCVAVVGTRSCTPDGARVAFEMGRDLAAAGVVVLSGLALGIDGSAHAGVLHALGHGPARHQAVPGPVAGPVGVAASGPDVVYPRQHARLWEEVARAGAILSEVPPGRPPAAWRFPARNRLIAALAHLVVVVESHNRGGSLITAEAAIARGIDVRAVPGPVRGPASAGTNQLLTDGPGPVRNAQDILDALGFVLPGPERGRRSRAPSVGWEAQGQAGPEGAVLATLGTRPSTVGTIAARSGLPIPSTAEALYRLQVAGLVRRHGDWWTSDT